MGKRKSSSNNEMSSILDQLKRSYSVDSFDSDNDTFDSEQSYQDTELASLLSKIVSDNSNEFAPEENEEGSDAETSDQEQATSEEDDEEIYVEDDISPRVTQDIDSILADEENEDDTIFADLEDEEDEDDTTFANLEDEEDEDDTMFADLEDEEDEDDTTFADLEDEEDEDDTTFADLEDEEDEDDTTFADLEDEEDEDDTTFADLEDEEDEDDTTFADLEDEEDEDDTTFADLEDEEYEDDATFADLQDEGDEDCQIIVESFESTFVEENSEPVEQTEADDIIDDVSEESSEDGEIIDEPEEESEDEDVPSTVASGEETRIEEPEYDEQHISEEIADDELPEYEQDNDVPTSPAYIISPEDYVYDPMQWSIGTPDSAFENDMPEDSAFEGHTRTKNMRDDDISLLLSLGYGDELNREVGSDRTQSVAKSMNSAFVPDKGRIPYGYCGKEFTEKEQIDSIRQRYVFDKRMLIIKLASFSVIAIILALVGVMSKLHSGVSSPIMFPIIELIIMTLGCVIIHKELFSGAKSIFKFASTSFAVPLLSLVLFYAYNLFTIICYIIDKSDVLTGGMPLFGFPAALFSVFALICEILNCTREQKTFNLICSSEELYAAELLTGKTNAPELRSPEIRRATKGNAVKVRRSGFIAGYFKKTSEAYPSSASTFLLAGIVSLSVVVAACVSLFLEKSIHEIATSIIFAAFMTMFASVSLSAAVTLFTASDRLREDGCDVIGKDMIREYAEVDTVLFKDSAILEVGDDIDVIPSSNIDVQKSMKIASRLFAALGGPISTVIGQSALDKDSSVSGASINISHVKDNGIDLYMDNTMHIILGDEAFVQSYGIKLNSSKNQIISSAKANGKCALYLAIDDVLAFCYVFVPSVRDNVIDNINKLYKNQIHTFISTYEPEISDSRFMGTHKIKVYKPFSFEDSKITSVDGSVIAASDASKVTLPLLMCRKVSALSRKVRRLMLLFAAVGLLATATVLLLGYLADVDFMLRHRDFFAIGAQLLAVIPIFMGRIKKTKGRRTEKSEQDGVPCDNKKDNTK